MAKKLLVEGYDGLKAQPEFPEDATPYAQRSRVEAMTWLVQLYDEWDKPDEAAKWRARRPDPPKPKPSADGPKPGR